MCYIPLSISIDKATPTAAFKKGLLFGFVFSFIAYFWMIPGAERFTGGSMWYGVVVIVISVLLMSLYHGCLLCFFSMLRNKGQRFRIILANALLMACIICAGEALLMVATGWTALV